MTTADTSKLKTSAVRVSAWRIAAVLLLIATFSLWSWSAFEQFVPGNRAVSFKIVLTDVGVIVAVASILSLVIRYTIGRKRNLPSLYIWSLLVSVGLLFTMRAGASQTAWYIIVGLLLAGTTLLGRSIILLLPAHARLFTDKTRRNNVVLFTVAFTGIAAAGWWLAWPGPGTTAPLNGSDRNRAMRMATQPITVADPTISGAYRVKALTYGSGNDRQRPEYNKAVDIQTVPVDATKILNGWKGASAADRTNVWGFDASQLPVNGRVWYPDAAGSFPLVLIVHGNSNASVFSDPGYEYLGRLLASKGYIAASIDENFLNTGLLDKSGGLGGASATRGWMILEHLRNWTAWNDRPGNMFYRKVDTSNIALIGHSRGGEAVAIAADFNRRQNYPDNPDLVFNYGYDIRSVIALAPSEGQYQPGNADVAFKDTNYLVLQGSYDADVASFVGLNQLHRVRNTPGSVYFTSALYIDRANHAQFNSVWGSRDVGKGIMKYIFNDKGLLPPREQRRIAQVYSAAFLAVTLKGQSAYKPLFIDYRNGLQWLPNTAYQNQYADSRDIYLDTGEASNATTTGSMRVEQIHLPLRFQSGDRSVTKLSWDKTASPVPSGYRLALREGTPTDATAESKILWDMAQLAEVPPTDNVSIVLEDTQGHKATLKLNDAMPLQAPIRNQYVKPGIAPAGQPTEAVLQTYALKMTDFIRANPDFLPNDLSAVTLLFDSGMPGAVLIDDFRLSL